MEDYWKDALAAAKSRPIWGHRKKANAKAPAPSKKSGRKRDTGIFVGTYHDYMKSRQWRKKCAKARKHYGHKCCRCQSTRNLQVHHRHYRTLFREAMADLELLCGGCHLNHHEGQVPGVMDPLTRQFVELVRSTKTRVPVWASTRA